MTEPGDWVTLDGNEAAAFVAHKTSDVVAIYPITPSSPMGESCDEWSSRGLKNLWGEVPRVIEMQSEGGAAGALHGSLQAGAISTTFTSSQGLLLMLPNLYKIAGELTPAVIHVAARSLATHALSIFGDHSDFYACRGTGWAMLVGASVQEVMDFALVAQSATLASRIPFLHVFDGFRTSHEVMKIRRHTDGVLRGMIDDELVRAFRVRGLTPDRPVLRGTAQNPDVFFQHREAAGPYYDRVPEIVEQALARFASLTGRAYSLYEYEGDSAAERVIVAMGSACETAGMTIEALRERTGDRIGLLKVRLYRPFDAKRFVAALPPTVRSIAVLDRSKEPGSTGEPLYLDVLAAFHRARTEGFAPWKIDPVVVGGRYGLSSKEFTPTMTKAVFAHLSKDRPANGFTVGIEDDISGTSLPLEEGFQIGKSDVVRAVFWGLGADGTVSANKNSIKIIGEGTENFAQGYFVYDSKKAGTVTVSHLRFGPRPIRSTFCVRRANFVGVHQFGFLHKYDVFRAVDSGAVVLLNAPGPPEEVWDKIPRPQQEILRAKKVRLYAIDAYEVARKTGMGVRINTVMQSAFFAVSGVLPREEAIEQIRKAIRKTYGKRGESIVKKNFEAVDAALEALHEISVPDRLGSIPRIPAVGAGAPAFVRDVLGEILAGRGDDLPVSAFPADGTYPTGTSCWEKRNIATEVPVWEEDLCIQCGKCVLVCPHATIRAKVYDPTLLADAPATFRHAPARWKEFPDRAYTIQVAVEDCTGCRLCVEACPAKDKSNASRKALGMAPQFPLREAERANWDFFLSLPEAPRANSPLAYKSVKDTQLLQPLFEFSGACAGCGETPYLRLLSALFGDRLLIANATGCSSIYGGNLPTTPWAANAEGRGPAWSNSLFEDNAEFGLGMRLALDARGARARALLERLAPDLVQAFPASHTATYDELATLRARVTDLRARLVGIDDPAARDLEGLADDLVPKSVWIVGGDGWAYDIGYGGLDHVLASGRKVNVLVLDTEVYSNTGGQSSKATPLGAVAKFAAGGKPSGKKDLGRMASAYGDVYVATVAMGAKDAQTVQAFLEAEHHPGPSILIAYSHCIAHGIEMHRGMEEQRLAVETGPWILYRSDPARAAAGENPLVLDSPEPKRPLVEYLQGETRFRMLGATHPEAMERYARAAQEAVRARWREYAARAAKSVPPGEEKKP